MVGVVHVDRDPQVHAASVGARLPVGRACRAVSNLPVPTHTHHCLCHTPFGMYVPQGPLQPHGRVGVALAEVQLVTQRGVMTLARRRRERVMGGCWDAWGAGRVQALACK